MQYVMSTTMHAALLGRILLSVVLLLMSAMAIAAEPPAVLQITIERVHPGGEARYSELEERMAESCMRLGCPNSYLALESIDAPKEVWWFVEHAAEADIERLGRAYAANPPLLDALNALAAQKKDIVDPPVEHITKYRAEQSAPGPWRVGSESYAVIATGARAGAVFESAQHALFTIVSAAALDDANAAAAKLGPSARIFRVRPTWSRPEDIWVAANPELWGR
jgi:hypothetical protein